MIIIVIIIIIIIIIIIMKVTVIPIVIGALGTVTKGLLQRTGGLGNKRMGGDHLNYSIVEIG